MPVIPLTFIELLTYSPRVFVPATVYTPMPPELTAPVIWMEKLRDAVVTPDLSLHANADVPDPLIVVVSEASYHNERPE